jgi:Fe-S cluster biogenesis protein NfuA
VSWLSRFLGDNAEDSTVSGDPERVSEVERVLEEIRPMLALDGGDFRLVAVEGNVVVLRARGACAGCHAQATTLTEGLERRLRERCAWFESVRANN